MKNTERCGEGQRLFLHSELQLYCIYQYFLDENTYYKKFREHNDGFFSLLCIHISSPGHVCVCFPESSYLFSHYFAFLFSVPGIETLYKIQELYTDLHPDRKMFCFETGRILLSYPGWA